MSKEQFKKFVRLHPELINYVNNNKMTWQKFYDMYDFYGEDYNVWSPYINNSSNKKDSVKELFQMIRSVDLDSVQKGISGMQKAIGLIQDLGIGVGSKNNVVHEAKPMYQYFDD